MTNFNKSNFCAFFLTAILLSNSLFMPESAFSMQSLRQIEKLGSFRITNPMNQKQVKILNFCKGLYGKPLAKVKPTKINSLPVLAFFEDEKAVGLPTISDIDRMPLCSELAEKDPKILEKFREAFTNAIQFSIESDTFNYNDGFVYEWQFLNVVPGVDRCYVGVTIEVLSEPWERNILVCSNMILLIMLHFKRRSSKLSTIQTV